mmetsp:Transcript_14885/g.42903  ORF Transcript_14885/g.42903 Transcript_14885/m.42903 type:complete len:263 (+) Transcript_14885:1009-1797(+)
MLVSRRRVHVLRRKPEVAEARRGRARRPEMREPVACEDCMPWHPQPSEGLHADPARTVTGGVCETGGAPGVVPLFLLLAWDVELELVPCADVDVLRVRLCGEDVCLLHRRCARASLDYGAHGLRLFERRANCLERLQGVVFPHVGMGQRALACLARDMPLRDARRQVRATRASVQARRGLADRRQLLHHRVNLDVSLPWLGLLRHEEEDAGCGTEHLHRAEPALQVCGSEDASRALPLLRIQGMGHKPLFVGLRLAVHLGIQ